MREKKLNFKNAEVSYLIKNEEGRQTIFMLHAAFTDHGLFEDQVADFGNDCRIVLIDLPGHGSNRSLPASVSLRDMPEICARIAAENGIERCVVMGVSLGALVAQAFADRCPDIVDSVVIVGGYSIHKANEAVLKAQRKEGFKWLLYVLFSLDKFKRYVLRVSCHTERGRAKLEPGLLRFQRKSFASMGGMTTLLRKTAEPMPYSLLIVVGEHDQKLAHDAAAQLHGLEPRSELVVIPDAGHCANVDQPEAFNRILRRHLSGA